MNRQRCSSTPTYDCMVLGGATSPYLQLKLSTYFFWVKFIAFCISHQNWHTYCRQTQQTVLFSSIYATCFGGTDNPQAFEYLTLKTQHTYSRAPVSTDSVSAVYRGPKKKSENLIHKRFISFKTRAKRERAITWRNPAAQTHPVLDSSSFVPVPTLKHQNHLP
jgi:hypothetical protein